jgi:hypothetical protein
MDFQTPLCAFGVLSWGRESLSLWGLCTKKKSRALIERPYSREPNAVGAVYDRPGFFVQSPSGRGRGEGHRFRPTPETLTLPSPRGRENHRSP